MKMNRKPTRIKLFQGFACPANRVNFLFCVIINKLCADEDGGGWDCDVTNYYFGGSNQYTSVSAVPLVFKGMFLQVGFDNIST